jgi:hypothetical protein
MNTSLMSANMVKEIEQAENMAFVSVNKWCGSFFQIIRADDVSVVRTGFSSKAEATATLFAQYPAARIVGKQEFAETDRLVSLYTRRYQDEGHARNDN